MAPLDRDGKVTSFVFPRWFHVYVFLLYRTALLVYPLLVLVLPSHYYMDIASWDLEQNRECWSTQDGVSAAPCF